MRQQFTSREDFTKYLEFLKRDCSFECSQVRVLPEPVYHKGPFKEGELVCFEKAERGYDPDKLKCGLWPETINLDENGCLTAKCHLHNVEFKFVLESYKPVS